ncbi:DUF4202 domain-containing protein [Plasticicumulans sp.]|uniref:DUF4202 domain-containing protein n=1 Tax=Plasticicumulans sp. TaxID=2307179 RepID=UPI0039435203|nr:DUF4202 domain-containing protein [Pseudomonadota bacterium]
MSRTADALAAFDAINAEDPQRIEVAGVPTPRTLVHARSVSQWIERLHPQASEALLLAARAHHLRRWEHPRSQWPMTREGYLRWRLELKRIHAEVAAGVLGALGYEPELISRVGALIRRERLKLDPEAQALEDAICLAFLEHDFDNFGPQHDPAKVIAIVRKTWAKMSEHGRSAALTLSLSDYAQSIVAQALAPTQA